MDLALWSSLWPYFTRIYISDSPRRTGDNYLAISTTLIQIFAALVTFFRKCLGARRVYRAPRDTGAYPRGLMDTHRNGSCSLADLLVGTDYCDSQRTILPNLIGKV